MPPPGFGRRYNADTKEVEGRYSIEELATLTKDTIFIQHTHMNNSDTWGRTSELAWNGDKDIKIYGRRHAKLLGKVQMDSNDHDGLSAANYTLQILGEPINTHLYKGRPGRTKTVYTADTGKCLRPPTSRPKKNGHTVY